MEDFCPDQPILPEPLAARIRAGWLRIHSKKLEGADTDLCLREAYDVCAKALMNEGQELNDAVLCEYIPGWVVHWAAKKEWLLVPPPDHWYEDVTKCLSSRVVYWRAMEETAILGRQFWARIRAGWLKIHSKKLEGADTDLCLREAYDIMATAMRDYDQELTDVFLCEGIPALILSAYGDNWLPVVPREHRYEDLVKRVAGRIAYWQAEALVLRAKHHPKGQSSLHERWESLKEMGRLIKGPHEKIPETIVRTTLAQQYGIQAQDVTWKQIGIEVSRLQLIGGYNAVEIVPIDPATDENLFSYRFPAGIWGAVTDHMEAVLAESERDMGSGPSATEESSPPEELDTSPPALGSFDEERRSIEVLLDEYLLVPSYVPAAQPESQKAETISVQIDRLRQECRLTLEELAEKTGITTRSVQRHVAGDSDPYDRNVRAYERVFSNLLNRHVVIKKMP
jgi:hypothetical protein